MFTPRKGVVIESQAYTNGDSPDYTTYRFLRQRGAFEWEAEMTVHNRARGRKFTTKRVDSEGFFRELVEEHGWTVTHEPAPPARKKPDE